MECIYKEIKQLLSELKLKERQKQKIERGETLSVMADRLEYFVFVDKDLT